MKTKIFIFGITGRMGQAIASIIDNSENLELVGGYSHSQPNLNPSEKPDVVIDFSLPDALPQIKEFLSKNQCSLVSGITGYSETEFEELKALGASHSVFWASNMSFGVFLMCQLTETLAKYEKFYSFHVEETHHVHKKDKPSGTAITIDQAARKSSSNIGDIVAHREGEVFGLHRFIACGKNEKLEIVHEANDRELFAQGAVDVSVWLKAQNKGFFGMEDFFKTFQ